LPWHALSRSGSSVPGGKRSGGYLSRDFQKSCVWRSHARLRCRPISFRRAHNIWQALFGVFTHASRRRPGVNSEIFAVEDSRSGLRGLRLAEGSGRPLGTAEFVAGLERLLGRPIACRAPRTQTHRQHRRRTTEIAAIGMLSPRYLRGEVCALSALCAIRVGFGGVCVCFLVLEGQYWLNRSIAGPTRTGTSF
jgi:hypothetical protein